MRDEKKNDHKIAQNTDLSRVLLLVLTGCVAGDVHAAGNGCCGAVVTTEGGIASTGG